MVNFAAGLDHDRFEISIVIEEGIIARATPPDIRIRALNGRTHRQKMRHLARLWQRHPPRIVLSHITEQSLHVLEVRRRIGGDFPIVAVEQSTPSRLLQAYSGHSPLAWRRLVTDIRRHYQSADALIALCETSAVDLAELTGVPRGQIRIINNPVIPENLDALSCRRTGHRLVDDAQHDIVLAAGRFAEEKNFELLIRSFPSILAVRPSARLVILGEGDLRARYERLVADLQISEFVSFPGQVTNPFAFIKRAAVMVLPSYVEGVPNVLIEALACGTPIVATDSVGGNRELLRDGELGAIVPLNDSDALAKAIMSTLDAPPDISRLKARGADFSAASSITRYTELIEKLLLMTPG